MIYKVELSLRGLLLWASVNHVYLVSKRCMDIITNSHINSLRDSYMTCDRYDYIKAYVNYTLQF